MAKVVAKTAYPYLQAIDELLIPKTFVAGETLTAADLAVFAAVHPYIVRTLLFAASAHEVNCVTFCSQSKASHSDLVSHAAVTRHFDHVQNLPLVATALARSSVLSPANVSINVSDVPAIEIKPDVKVKKPKAEGAAAASEAQQPKKAANKDAVKADKQKAEQRSENAAEQVAGAKEKGEKKNKGEKKEKAPKEKKPAPPAAVVEAPAPWMVDLRVGKIIDGKSLVDREMHCSLPEVS